MKNTLRGITVVLSAVFATGAIGATAAHADTRTDAPGCSSVTEFGPVAKIVVNGETAASVRGYQGCGKTYAMTWVESDWAASHPGYTFFASMVNAETGAWVPGWNNGADPAQKLWSQGDSARDMKAGGGVGWHDCQNILAWVTPSAVSYQGQGCTTG